MEIFIEQANLIAPGHAQHGHKVNIHIVEGIIQSVSQKKITGVKKITGEDLYVSIGWTDIGTQAGEPGYEHRETLATLSEAALSGGYTHLAIFPNTKPTLNSKSEIEFILQKSKDLPVQIMPIGAISKQCQGKEMAEMIDMYHSGAIAFSDGSHPIQDTGLLQRAMLYMKHFDGLIINNPQDASLAALGQMHEGKMSQLLGLKGIPTESESIMLQRDIYIAGYSDVRYLAHLVTSDHSVSVLKQARKSNPKITSSISYLNLVLTDQSLEEFDSVYKQSPPLRSIQDQKSLIKAAKEKIIDIICTNHTPLEPEKKDLEFAYADPGTIGLQTAFAATNTQGILTVEDWVQMVAINPRRILKRSIPNIAAGQLADLTVFDSSEKWTFKISDIKSKSKNTPFINATFKGKVKATISNGHTWING